MLTASELAGFLAAQAIWCVCDGETLIPFLGYTNEAGDRKVERLVADRLEKGVAAGKEKLESNVVDANDAVLVYDGRIPLGGAKVDAIVLELRSYFVPDARAMIAVPYTPKSLTTTFRVHKPKFLRWEQCEDFPIEVGVANFFKGVDSHEKGSKIWRDALDERK